MLRGVFGHDDIRGSLLNLKFSAFVVGLDESLLSACQMFRLDLKNNCDFFKTPCCGLRLAVARRLAKVTRVRATSAKP